MDCNRGIVVTAVRRRTPETRIQRALRVQFVPHLVVYPKESPQTGALIYIRDRPGELPVALAFGYNALESRTLFVEITPTVQLEMQLLQSAYQHRRSLNIIDTVLLPQIGAAVLGFAAQLGTAGRISPLRLEQRPVNRPVCRYWAGGR